MPCRESRPLDELKFVLVKCEGVLVDGALKWKSHMITGLVKVWPGLQYIFIDVQIDVTHGLHLGSLEAKFWRVGGAVACECGWDWEDPWASPPACDWERLHVSCCRKNMFVSATAWTMQRFQPLTLERFQPLGLCSGSNRLRWSGSNRYIRWSGSNRYIHWSGSNRYIRWSGSNRYVRWSGSNRLYSIYTCRSALVHLGIHCLYMYSLFSFQGV